MVMPDDNVKMVVELICPIAMDDGLLAIREGGHAVGAGVVARSSTGSAASRRNSVPWKCDGAVTLLVI